MSRYLGIDFGEKRVGLAITDPTRLIAQPLETVVYKSRKELFLRLKKVIDDFGVIKIILGLPVSMNGSDSQKTREVRDFADDLIKQVSVPVDMLDERLTTVQANLLLQQLGKKASKSRDKVDQIAAQYILQTYLDREKNRGSL